MGIVFSLSVLSDPTTIVILAIGAAIFLAVIITFISTVLHINKGKQPNSASLIIDKAKNTPESNTVKYGASAGKGIADSVKNDLDNSISESVENDLDNAIADTVQSGLDNKTAESKDLDTDLNGGA